MNHDEFSSRTQSTSFQWRLSVNKVIINGLKIIFGSGLYGILMLWAGRFLNEDPIISGFLIVVAILLFWVCVPHSLVKHEELVRNE